MAQKRQNNAVESDTQSTQLGCISWTSSGKTGAISFRPTAEWQGSWGAFLLDFSMYLFLAPNGQGIPVFGREPKK